MADAKLCDISGMHWFSVAVFISAVWQIVRLIHRLKMLFYYRLNIIFFITQPAETPLKTQNVQKFSLFSHAMPLSMSSPVIAEVLSPEWMSMCCLRFCIRVKRTPHVGHWKGRSGPLSPGRVEGLMYRWYGYWTFSSLEKEWQNKGLIRLANCSLSSH